MSASSTEKKTVRCTQCDLEIVLPSQLEGRPLACPVCKLQLNTSPRTVSGAGPSTAARLDFEVGAADAGDGINLDEMLARAAEIDRHAGSPPQATTARSPAVASTPPQPALLTGWPIPPQPAVPAHPGAYPAPMWSGPAWPQSPTQAPPQFVPPVSIPVAHQPAREPGPAPNSAARGQAVPTPAKTATLPPVAEVQAAPPPPVAPVTVVKSPEPSSATSAAASPAETRADEGQVLVAICAACGRTLRAATRMAGRRVKCPKCAAPVSLPQVVQPGESPTSIAEQSVDLPAYIDQALRLSPPQREPLEAVLSASRVRKLTQRIEQGQAANASRSALEAAGAAIKELCESRDHRAAEVLGTLFPTLPLGLQSQALKQAAELADPELLPLVLPLLASPTEPLLRGAILCLGGLGDGRAVKPLIALAIAQPDHRVRVVSTLQRMTESARPELLALLQPGSDAAFTAVALEVLGQARDPACIPAMAGVLQQPSLALRRMAAEQLAQFEDRRATEALAPLAADPDEFLRLYAARGFARAPHARYLPRLLRLLDDPSRDVRLAVLEAIGGCGDAHAAEVVRPLLDADDDEIVVQAAEALGRLGDEQSVVRLIDRLEAAGANPEHQPLTLQLIDALRRIGDTRAALPFLNLLLHASPRVRARAAEAVGRLKDASAREGLEDLLRRDPMDDVRAAAARALGELGEPRAGRVLAGTGLVDIPAVRLPALIALGRLKDRAVLECMEQLATDSLPQVRYQLTHVLEELGDEAALPVLTTLACDGEELVRRGARRALQALGDTRSEKELQKAARRSGRRPQPASSHSLSLVTPQLKHRRSGVRDMSYGAAELVFGAPFRLWTSVRTRTAEASSGWMNSRTLLGVATVGLMGVGAVYSRAPQGMVTYSATPARGNVAALAAVDGGRLIVAGRTMRMIEVWDATTQKLLDREPNTPSTWIATSPDGTALLAADANCIRRYPLGKDGTLGPAEEQSGHTGVITQFAVSPDAQFVATVDASGVLIRWSLTGTARQTVTIGAPPVNVWLTAVALSPGGDRAALAYSTGRVTVWDVNTQQELASNETIKLPITALTFSKDGERLAAAAGLQGASLCSWSTLEPAVKPQAVAAGDVAIDRLVFRDDGRLLAAGGSSVAVWNLETGEAQQLHARITIDAWAMPTTEQLAVGDDEEREILIYGWNGKIEHELDDSPTG